MKARHVAIIMDGNGRWAAQRSRPRAQGHLAGAEAVRKAVRGARRAGLEALTLYAFSAQNWTRPAEEVAHLMALVVRFLRDQQSELRAHGIRLVVIGDRSRLPDLVRAAVAEAEAATSGGGAMTLALALSYGAREDLVAATRALARRAYKGDLDPASIDEATVAMALSTHGLPGVDLVIRTGGERRLSNFLLWEVAYAEFVFIDEPWPQFDEATLDSALAAFEGRQRRYGGLGASA